MSLCFKCVCLCLVVVVVVESPILMLDVACVLSLARGFLLRFAFGERGVLLDEASANSDLTLVPTCVEFASRGTCAFFVFVVSLT